MYFQEDERNRIVSRYAALYRTVLYDGDDGRAAAELAELGRAYEAVSKIRFEGAQYRTDIAHRAFGREELGVRS